MQEKLMTEREAAAYLRVAAITLNTWRHQKTRRAPVYVRVGRQIRYRENDLIRFLEQNAVSPNYAPAGADEPGSDGACS